MARFDVSYTQHGIIIDYHFCRGWDDEGGCYGTNESHGLTLEDACEEAAKWHDNQAKMYRERVHPSILSFTEDDTQ
jgi:hypothetical protein